MNNFGELLIVSQQDTVRLNNLASGGIMIAKIGHRTNVGRHKKAGKNESQIHTNHG